jgi:hypothetical protein
MTRPLVIVRLLTNEILSDLRERTEIIRRMRSTTIVDMLF